MINQTTTSSIHKYGKLDIDIDVPFPPDIKAIELVRKRKTFKKSMKSSNGFIIYRGQYLKQLHRLGFKPGMTQISTSAGRAWKAEPKNVKNWYAELAETSGKMIMQEHMKSVAFNNNNWVEWDATKNDKKQQTIPESQNLSNSQITQYKDLVNTPEASSQSRASNEQTTQQTTVNNDSFILQSTRDKYPNWPNLLESYSKVNVNNDNDDHHQYINTLHFSSSSVSKLHFPSSSSVSSLPSNQNHFMFPYKN
ncbi:2494_t:CDS:1 [Ambispora gerdemannii]|uniref:2494_t:CDS:1 n=1 Tax=Ambispora gerdemannii TaxID=144530 RepID=A0A9N9D3C7_9GLOM|nr:2494_t:CDS:1 [Ambispora gerdemannii]